VVGGQGAFAYVLPAAASSVTVTITDSTGAAVFTGNGTTTSGHNEVVWDGTNSFTGAQEPDGVYTIAVTATDSTGTAMTPDIHAIGIVDGVQTDSTGAIQLSVGGNFVDYSAVLDVRDPTRLATTTGTDTTTGGTDDTDTSDSGTDSSS
jgi:flagellar basal-body rod modification protein FlgD